MRSSSPIFLLTLLLLWTMLPITATERRNFELVKEETDGAACCEGFSLSQKVSKQRSSVKRHRPVHPEYHVDDIAKQAGHKVVGLPVAHSELNPIEIAWSQVKHFIQSHNKKFTLTEIKRLIRILPSTKSLRSVGSLS